MAATEADCRRLRQYLCVHQMCLGTFQKHPRSGSVLHSAKNVWHTFHLFLMEAKSSYTEQME